MKLLLSFWGSMCCFLVLHSQSELDELLTLETPFHTVVGHYNFTNSPNYDPDKAAICLTGSDEEENSYRLAIQLRQIYEGKGLYLMPDIPTIRDYKDPLTRKEIYIPYPSKLPEIYVEKVDGSWFFAEESIDVIPLLHKKVYPQGASWLIDVEAWIGKRLGYRTYLGLLIIIPLFLMGLIIWYFGGLWKNMINQFAESGRFPPYWKPQLLIQIGYFALVSLLVTGILFLLPTLYLSFWTGRRASIVLLTLLTILLGGVLIQIIELVAKWGYHLATEKDRRINILSVAIVKNILQGLVLITVLFWSLFYFNDW